MTGSSASGIVELRVHGVSGTPPEALLDCPQVEQVAGDAKAGFYRPRLIQDRLDPRDGAAPPLPAQRPELEGYAWGGLTSGSPSRALWLLLLPFTLTNVAPRMRPPGPPNRVLWFVSRLLALTMTVLIVLAACGIGLDLFAWQCGTGPARATCTGATGSPSWVDALAGLSPEHRLALGALVPLALLYGLRLVSGRTINSYEGIRDTLPDSAEDADATEPGLTSPWMWRNEQQVRRLGGLHVQAGLAAVLCAVWGPFHGSDPLRGVLAGVMTAYAVVLLTQPAFTGRRRQRLLNRLQWAVLALLLLALAVTGGLLLWADPLDATRGAGLPGYADSLIWVFFTQLGCLVAFAASIAVLAARARRLAVDRAALALRDCTAILFAILAVFLGAVFSSGLYVFVGTYLVSGQVRPNFGAVTQAGRDLVVPQIVQDANSAYAVSVVAVALGVAVLLAWLLAGVVLRKVRRAAGLPFADDLAAGYAGTDVRSPAQQPRARSIAAMVRLARLVDQAPRAVLAVVVTGSAISVAFIVLLCDARWGLGLPGDLHRWHSYDLLPTDCNATLPGGYDSFPECGFASSTSLQATGGLLTILSLGLLVTLAAAAFRVPKTRRSVGILWDLASFWPRAAHPFAAPCYAERGVPDLMTRIHWRITADGKPVLLAAHSQGTILSFAVLQQVRGRPAQLRARLLPQLTFLTFGCVIRRLYARFFPAYFAPDDVVAVGTDLRKDGRTGWLNLWRYTDYLGGQVAGDSPPAYALTGDEAVTEVYCRDPVWERPPGATQWPAPGRHSDYWRSPEYTVAVQQLQSVQLGLKRVEQA